MARKSIVTLILIIASIVAAVMVFSSQAHAINYFKEGIVYNKVTFKVISISVSDADSTTILNNWASAFENSEHIIIDIKLSEKKVLIIYIELRDQPASVKKLFEE